MPHRLLPHRLCFALQDTTWADGHVVRKQAHLNSNVLKQARGGATRLMCWAHRSRAACTQLPGLQLGSPPASESPTPQVNLCKEGKRAGRLYFTDGSMPAYWEQGYPHNAPGAWASAGLGRRGCSGCHCAGFGREPSSAQPSPAQPGPAQPINALARLPALLPRRRHAVRRGRVHQRADAARGAVGPCHQLVPSHQGARLLVCVGGGGPRPAPCCPSVRLWLLGVSVRMLLSSYPHLPTHLPCRARARAARAGPSSWLWAAAPTSPPSTLRPRYAGAGAGVATGLARWPARTAGPLSLNCYCPHPLLPLQRRRSYNCGTGDMIIQPLATAEDMR